MSNRPKLSIIVPLHNEVESLPLLLPALHNALAKWGCEWEVICVDDGSRDDTWAQVVALATTDSRICGLRFTRNFGKEAAILAGLEAARGDWIVVMDGDGQHPPALLPKMLACAEDESVAIVAAKKRTRDADTWFARVLSRGFNRIMLAATGLDLQNACDYRLLKRPVVDALLRMPERIRFFRAMTVWTGFKQVDIEFDVLPRLAGQTAWSTRGLLSLAINGITGFSAQPLTLVFRLGFFGLAVSVALTAQAIWSWETGNAISGWTSLTIVMVFFGSANLLALGVLGAYIAQLFNEIKARPPYLVGSRVRV
ncbi:MAG: glycosyltransferase family 2 protein [Rhodoferax sp.]|nr:glycosyltransferase family 2 protein [Rhodoferax sp.]MDP3651261.1 glycosyltransferase family 2 protein [Rhodoferax sp.]